MKKLLLTAVMLMAVVFVLTSCTKKDPCEMFADPLLSDIGTVSAAIAGADVSIDWDGTVEEFESYTVEVDGTIVMDQKPANFTGLAEGSYTATVTYSKTDCTDLTASTSFDIGCLSWPGTLSFTVTATTSNDSVTIDVDAAPAGNTGVTVSVTPQGTGSTPADEVAIPATFTGLANDTYDVLVSYANSNCSGTVDATASFTINFVPVSLSVDIEPWLNDDAGAYDCDQCHGQWGPGPYDGNFDSTMANLYTNLTSPVDDTTCATGNRVIPGDSANSLFYLVLAGPCGASAQMPAWGTPITAGELQLIADWIDQGALDN